MSSCRSAGTASELKRDADVRQGVWNAIDKGDGRVSVTHPLRTRHDLCRQRGRHYVDTRYFTALSGKDTIFRSPWCSYSTQVAHDIVLMVAMHAPWKHDSNLRGLMWERREPSWPTSPIFSVPPSDRSGSPTQEKCPYKVHSQWPFPPTISSAIQDRTLFYGLVLCSQCEHRHRHIWTTCKLFAMRLIFSLYVIVGDGEVCRHARFQYKAVLLLTGRSAGDINTESFSTEIL